MVLILDGQKHGQELAEVQAVAFVSVQLWQEASGVV
jgi:hypothetical protein